MLVINGGPLQSDSMQATVPIASNLTEDIFGIETVQSYNVEID